VLFRSGPEYRTFLDQQAKELLLRPAASLGNWLEEGDAEHFVLVVRDIAQAMSTASGVPVVRIYRDLTEGLKQAQQGDGTFNIVFPDPEKREKE
jgi:hypothetical protein